MQAPRLSQPLFSCKTSEAKVLLDGVCGMGSKPVEEELVGEAREEVVEGPKEAVDTHGFEAGVPEVQAEKKLNQENRKR